MTDAFKNLSPEETDAFVKSAVAPPVAITLVYDGITGLSMSVIGSNDAEVIEKVLMGAIKEMTRKEFELEQALAKVGE